MLLNNNVWISYLVAILSLDQTDLGDRMALLMLALRVGDRALPLVWRAEEGTANIGFEGQKTVLEQIQAWLPVGVHVILLSPLGRGKTPAFRRKL
ncbi:hypothetical protein [Rhabdochromatium marinum]|uniref:hypothetical protein n=1 Tax=Rhabdochromatium marinum TaxID=48729 RepID=UPI001F5B4C9E|nr:hypothetical protein [Rhabdochromatium marinum]